MNLFAGNSTHLDVRQGIPRHPLECDTFGARGIEFSIDSPRGTLRLNQ